MDVHVLKSSRTPSGHPRRAWLVLSHEGTDVVQFDGPVLELMTESRTRFDHRLTALGPDIIRDDWDEDRFIARLRRDDPTRGIGDALLDQRILAGIGNMYAAELCFLAGVRPHAPVSAVADLPRLVRRAKALLEVNKERAQQATTGDLRRGRTHYVYSRAGQPCRRCRTRVERGTHGAPPRDRVTFWCPTCQPPSP